MAKCWEQRGCDEEMQADCPHPIEFGDNCPTKCAFASACPRPTHEVTTDPALIFDPTVDREAADQGRRACTASSSSRTVRASDESAEPVGRVSSPRRRREEARDAWRREARAWLARTAPRAPRQGIGPGSHGVP